jgi:ABC-type lipoprotein release transport system permease subunit
MTELLQLLFPLSWRNLWRNPRRTVITVLVVSVGLWSILIFAVLLRAWSQSSRDTTLRLMTAEGEIHARGYLDDPTAAHRMPMPTGALARILASPRISAWSPRIRISAIVQSEYKTLPITLVGVIPHRERTVSDIPGDILQGRYLAGPDDSGIVIGRDLARRLKTQIGRRVVVMAQDAAGHLRERAFQVVGLYGASRDAEDEFTFTGIRPAQVLIHVGKAISEIAFDAKQAKDLPQILLALKAVAPHRDIQSWKTLAPLAYAVSTFFNSFIFIWLWVMFALMAIGIVNTQLMAVVERVHEFGLLQALGMRPRLVLYEVALESMLLIGVGVVLGIALASASIAAFPGGIDLGFLGRGAELVGAGRVLHPHINARDFALYSAIVWGAGVIATLWPARRAAKVSPVEAMGRT